MKAVVDYAEKAAIALGYIQGPSHIEVLLTSVGPRLQDAGWRCHGGLGTWLPIAQECIGKHLYETFMYIMIYNLPIYVWWFAAIFYVILV